MLLQRGDGPEELSGLIGATFSVISIVTSHSKCLRALAFEKVRRRMHVRMRIHVRTRRRIDVLGRL